VNDRDRVRYQDGILVRIIKAGRSTSGRVYTQEALADVAGIINGTAAVPVKLGHLEGAVAVGRIVGPAEVIGDAVFGRLLGIEPDELIAMREGAAAAGATCLGISIRGEGTRNAASGEVVSLNVLESVDLCARSGPEPGAGGRVVFGGDGRPVAWAERQRHWRDAQPRPVEAPPAPVLDQQVRALEAVIAKLSAVTGARPSARSVLIHESFCGHVLAPIA
jgi:hypothetical protein